MGSVALAKLQNMYAYLSALKTLYCKVAVLVNRPSLAPNYHARIR